MNDETTIPARRRVLSGMRPTGRLHLGNYVGALKNWVDLQDATNADGSPKYECYFFIADYHALTTDYADTSLVLENIGEVMLDFLAAGLDPELCTIFRQSKVPPHFELYALLGMITPLSWLERVPSYKDQQEQLKEKDLATFGFLGYPLLSGGLRSRGSRPGSACGDHARDRAAVQSLLWAVGANAFSGLARQSRSAGAEGAADAEPQAAGDGWAQDVEELWQHDSAERSGAGGAREAEDNGD
jgi:hypothetical protein